MSYAITTWNWTPDTWEHEYSLIKRKFLIKQDLNYYSIKPEFYFDGNYQSLELEGETEPNINDFENYGFNLEDLTTDSYIDMHTFKPIDKFDNEFKIIMGVYE